MKIFAENKKARFDYEFVEKFEAGVALNGQEAKSIKTRGLSLAGSYIIVKPSGVFWIGTKIPAYQPANAGADYREERDRKLLLRKIEIRRLNGIASQKGLTFIPLRLYTKEHYENSGKIKLEFGVGRGKKKFDKRETLKKRDIDREINRTLRKFG
jgi:SsrA-binding protein